MTIDPLFAATVDTSQYHIFLAPEGESNGLYVSGKSAGGFTVREVQGGKSNLAFSYRLVARRKDVSAPRLASVMLPKLPATRPVPAPIARSVPPAPAMRTAPSARPAAQPLATARPHDQAPTAPSTVATPAVSPVPLMVATPPDPPRPQA